MINLFKQTKSNFYSMDFRLNGKRIKKSTGQSDKKAAMAVAMEEYTRLKAEADDNKIGRGVIRLADAFDVVIKGVAGSKSTEKNYKWAKNKTLGFGLFAKHHHLPQDLMLHELTQEMLDDLIANRRDEGMKPNSINVELRVLRAVVNKFKGTHKAPAINGIKTIKGFVKTRYLSDKEEAAVLAKLSAMEGVGAGNAYDLCVFLLDTGCRLSEALNTEWSMLDLDLGEYEVYRIKTQSHDVIPLSPRLVQILNRRRNYAKPFVSMDYSVKVLRKVLDDLCNKNSVINTQKGKVTPHALRDTYASRLVKEGLTLHELSSLLGHTTAAMSAKYSHLENRDVATKARMLMAQRHAGGNA